MSITRLRLALKLVNGMLGGRKTAAHAIRFNTVVKNIPHKAAAYSFGTYKIMAYDASNHAAKEKSEAAAKRMAATIHFCSIKGRSGRRAGCWLTH